MAQSDAKAVAFGAFYVIGGADFAGHLQVFGVHCSVAFDGRPDGWIKGQNANEGAG
jgi:hypothetical protein